MTGKTLHEKVVAILQPGYIPWLGFFEQLWRADLLIYLDDVQYTKGDWRNRNKIKTIHAGEARWLTVPVCQQPVDAKINDTLIDYSRNWVKRHLNLIRQNYARAPFFGRYFNKFEAVLEQRPEHLVDLSISCTAFLADAFEIDTPCVRSSKYHVSGIKTVKLVNLCKAVDATELYDGASARSFINHSLLNENEIRITYQNYQPIPYRQQVLPFTPFLSAMDLLFNCGPDGMKTIIAGGK